jgi:DNA primase
MLQEELPFRLTLAWHPYLAERGLKRPTCAHFGVGYCTRGICQNSIAIPIHDGDNRLVAYAARRLTVSPGEGKYRFPRRFLKSSVLFNACRISTTAPVVIVVEGFFDVFRLHQAGFPNTVALMGCYAGTHQVSQLLALGRPVIVMLDGDDAGRIGTQQLCRTLRQAGHSHRAVQLREGVQPEHLTIDALQALLGVP